MMDQLGASIGQDRVAEGPGPLRHGLSPAQVAAEHHGPGGLALENISSQQFLFRNVQFGQTFVYKDATFQNE